MIFEISYLIFYKEIKQTKFYFMYILPFYSLKRRYVFIIPNDKICIDFMKLNKITKT